MLRRLLAALSGDPLATHEQVEQVRQDVADVKESMAGMTTEADADKKEATKFAKELRGRLDRLEAEMNSVKPGSSQLRSINGG